MTNRFSAFNDREKAILARALGNYSVLMLTGDDDDLQFRREQVLAMARMVNELALLAGETQIDLSMLEDSLNELTPLSEEAPMPHNFGTDRGGK